MPTPAQEDLTLALELADIADAITLPRFKASDLQVETKPDLTPVSESDKAAELAIRQHLARQRPDELIIGEEFGGLPEDAKTGRAWIIDPIDGTKSYVRGVATWSTLIALSDHDELTVAVVSMPAIQRRWWATRGGGAFTSAPGPDGRPATEQIHVSKVSSLADAQLGWSGIEDWDAVGKGDQILALARSVWRTRGIGDAWQYMLVAEGAFEIATDPEATLWDLAAPCLIVAEAGGTFTTISGEKTAGGGSGFATNGLLHEAARALVAD
jgi:histidinol-phosphatase